MKRLQQMITGFALLMISSGCAGPRQLFSCDNFDQYAFNLPPDPVTESIQADFYNPVGPSPDAIASEVLQSPLAQQIYERVALHTPQVQALHDDEGHHPAPSDNAVLLLSGGGQWGAFGAGFLQGVNQHHPESLPRFAGIGGVSTGAVQALFVGPAIAINDPARRAAALTELNARYAIVSERDLVKRGGALRVLSKASFADISPLRRKLEEAICPDVTAADACPLLSRLAQPDAPQVYVGMVEASTGTFKVVWLNAIARAFDKKRLAATQARDCTVGAVMGSSAIPVYYQEVAIGSGTGKDFNGKTYYDGGVRHSVFDTAVAMLHSPAFQAVFAQAYVMQLQREQGIQERAMIAAVPEPERDETSFEYPDLYVIRNGPTTVQNLDPTNRPVAATRTGERAYSILVNQAEVQSIASLRLSDPYGNIYLATADQFLNEFIGEDDKFQPLKGPCKRKLDGTMFDPKFMACLRALGRFKAKQTRDQSNSPWMMVAPAGASLRPKNADGSGG